MSIYACVFNPCWKRPYELHLYKRADQLWPHEIRRYENVEQRSAAIARLGLAVLAICLLFGCGDNRHVAYLLDAAPDAACEASPDANAGCCALYPDEDAIRACAAPTFPVGSCGVLACVATDCSFLRVNVCHRAPRCSDLGCAAIACDLTPPLCTCRLADGSFTTCDDS